MGKSINDNLINLFKKHRIVFWHDYKKEMLEDFLLETSARLKDYKVP